MAETMINGNDIRPNNRRVNNIVRATVAVTQCGERPDRGQASVKIDEASVNGVN